MRDPASLHPQLCAIIAGDELAWSAFATALIPHIAAISRAHEALKRRGLATNDDDLAEIRVATLERLRRDSFRNLQRYLEQANTAERPQSFESWFYSAVDFTILEHVRKRFGRAPRGKTDDGEAKPASKRHLHSLAARIDVEPGQRSVVQALGVVTQLSVAEIFAYIEAEFSAEEATALRMYYKQDVSLEQLAAALGLPDVAAANKLIRKLNARLRYRFGGTEG